MTEKEFTELAKRQIALEEHILLTKGNDYTRGENDRFANFRRTARNTGLTEYEVWQVFFEKHYDAIVNYLKNGKESEPIEQRIADARNYLLLLLGMIKENKKGEDEWLTGELIEEPRGEH